MTPEAVIKRAVKNSLAKFTGVHAVWPVPYGYSRQQLDCVICVLGRYIAIECKAPGKEPTALQDSTIKKIRAAGGTVFIIDGTQETDTVQDLEAYIRGLNKFLERETLKKAVHHANS